MARKPTYEELVDKLEALCDAVRDCDRYDSEEDRAERRRCFDEAVNVAAKARAAETCGA